jgi:hypothetical protein
MVGPPTEAVLAATAAATGAERQAIAVTVKFAARELSAVVATLVPFAT